MVGGGSSGVQIADELMELPERTRFQILAPVVQQKKGEFADLLRNLAPGDFFAMGPALSATPVLAHIDPTITEHLGKTPELRAAASVGPAAVATATAAGVTVVACAVETGE